MGENFYETLGVGKDADLKKIKGAFRKKAKELHPDMPTSRNDAEEFMRVEEAYEVLSDKKKRRRYDEELEGFRSRERDPAAYRSDPMTENVMQRGFPLSDIARFLFDDGRVQRYRIILSPIEAASGVSCPLSYTIRCHCPRCEGRTFFDMFLCPWCRGAGALEMERSFVLELPPGVRHGTSLRLTPDGATLTVDIQISSAR